MATLDQLAAEQRAIIDLVLQRGRSYDELATMLDIPGSRVRELARDALIQLSPVSAERVESERRGQIADYVLRQQSGGEETATKALLRRSEAGRAWTSSLIDSLADMYDGDRPEIPEAEAEAPSRRRERERPRERERIREPRAERTPARERRPAREPRQREREPRRREQLSPDAQAAVRRRRIAAALLGALVLAGVVVGIIAIASGGGDGKKKSKTTAARAQTKLIGQLLLKPVNGASSTNQGIAVIATQGNQPELIVQAKLPPSKQGTAYGVWLYNSPTDNLSLGAQVTDQAGNYQGRGNLPSNLSKYKYIDISLQPIPDRACQSNPTCLKNAQKHSGTSVLRGKVADMQAPQTGAGAGAGAAPGQTTAPGQTPAPGGAQTTP
jgi:hypothetical protein